MDRAAGLLHGADLEVDADGGEKALFEAPLGVSQQEA